MEDNNDLQPIHIFSYPFIYQQKALRGEDDISTLAF
jgi:hypothetical protein